MNYTARGPWAPHRQQDSSNEEYSVREGQRVQLFIDLSTALWTPAEEKKPSLGTFAACETIKYSEGFILPSFHVEGVGELRLPLSAEDTSILRGVCEQAPFGKGLNTIVDTRVRRCWQVDASKVSFPGAPEFLTNIVQPLATKAVGALGLDGEGAQLEAHLYKLLLYEAGGHFSFHRDTEKEKGMFATLVLQLPTDEGYKGGKLVVKHDKATKKFDSHMVSTLGFCYTVFFADCLHELQEIESGTRLCLAFNLVKRDCSLDAAHRDYISTRVGKVESALKPWLEAATDRKLNIFGAKLAIPLQHKYTEENLSFAGLKGEDSTVAELLKECRDQNGNRWLDIQLCLVTKHLVDEGNGSYTEENIEFENWIQLDDNPVPEAFENLVINLEEETIIDPFSNEPDEEEYEGHMGNSGPKLEQWYHKAMIVVWPKLLSFSVACEADFSSALEKLESTLKSNDPNSDDSLHQIVCFCENHASQVWQAGGDSKEDSMTPRLMNLCIRISVPKDVVRILQLLVKTIHYKAPRYSYQNRYQTFKVGVRNIEVAEAIASAVQAFGWELVSAPIINLVNECALAQGESFAQLAKQLISLGVEDAGAIVAETTFKVFETLISDLESHTMPEFTWHQPQAKLPGYPEIEAFLKGPEDKHVYRGVKGLPAMRSFAETHFNKYGDHTATDGYSATGTPGGKGQEAFCLIQKTRRLYEKALDHWRQEQEQGKRLRLELGKLRSVVPQINAVNVTSFVSTSEFDGRDSKRKRADTEVTEDTGKRAKSSAVEVIDLDLSL